MRTWNREGYVVNEIEFDGNLNHFEVVRDNGEIVSEICPDDIDSMNAIIEDLDNGEDVDGWEDGFGNTISL